MSDGLTWRAGNELLSSVGGEQWLADRIKSERSRPDRKWSQLRLSQELAKHGCYITQPAISNIESPPKGEARRTISIDEAIGFAKAFEIPVGELLLPPDATRHFRFFADLTETSIAVERAEVLGREADASVADLAARLDADEELSQVFDAFWKESPSVAARSQEDLRDLGAYGDREQQIRAYIRIRLDGEAVNRALTAVIQESAEWELRESREADER